MKNYLKRFLALVMALCLTSACFSGCGSNSDSSEKAGTVISQMYSDIVALDPARMYDSATMTVLQQVTEGILAQQMDGSMKPFLCESWESTDDVTYVYHMRSDIVFSNGDPMTMDDVLFSMERHRDPEVASYLAWMYENVESITQTGDWEFTVKLYSPDATWQYVLGTAAGVVIQKSACLAAGENFGRTPEGLVATGPYVVDSWTIGSEVKLSYNKNYWDPAYSAPDVKNIIFTVIPEDTTRASALMSGQTDVDLIVPGELMQTLIDSDKVEVRTKESGDFLFLSFNCSKAPFDDVNVRRAISSAIPKEDINSTIVGGVGEKAGSLPMSSYLYTFERESWEEYAKKVKSYDYNMEQAKSYLASSAYPDGFTVSLICDETGMNNSIALIIQQSLAELGITVNIEKMSYDEVICHEFGEYVDENGNHTYEMGLFEWEADWPDPSGNVMGIFNSAYIGEGGTNVPDYINENVDELLNAQSVIMDEKERTRLLQEALDIIVDECPIVPISYMYYKMGFGERVDPSFDCVTWGMYYKDMKLK